MPIDDSQIGHRVVIRSLVRGETGPSGGPLMTDVIGFLLLGPHTLYPDHAHAAEEVYHVVSGRASWRRGDGPWRPEPPGAVVHHAPHVPHAMRTEHEPLLALYCWMGDVATPADLLKDERHG